MPEKIEYPKKQSYYCCLYHFISGKSQKTATYCYSHVPLGLITPIHFTKNNKKSNNFSPVQNIDVNSDKFNLLPHNHFSNEFQLHLSLPKRLAQPRVYVEKVNRKYTIAKDAILTAFGDLKKNIQYEEIFKLFRILGRKNSFRSQKQLKDSILDYFQEYKFTNSFNYLKENLSESKQTREFLLQKQDFLSYLQNHHLSTNEANQLWSAAYNKNRFNISQKSNENRQFISLKAFLYNFNKFYLAELETYKNMLSESACRQRMIDVRFILEPWFTSNIILKDNMKRWKTEELEICDYLKRYEEKQLYIAMVTLIQKRNKLWLYLRNYAKLVYNFTDQKNIGLENFNQRATQLIDEKKEEIQSFIKFIDKFQTQLINKQQSLEETFKITDLIDFLQKNSEYFESQLIIKYIRNIFKYLYFYNKDSKISLNRSTKNLDCSSIVDIDLHLLQEFLSFKKKQVDQSINIIGQICSEINQIVDSRPDIQGNKRFLLQCNYLAEAFLRNIKILDFTAFYKVWIAVELYRKHQINQIQKIKLILTNTNQQNFEIPSLFWNKYFNFQEKTPIFEQIVENNSRNYRQALQDYNKVKLSLLNDFEIKISPKNMKQKIQEEIKAPNKKKKQNNERKTQNSNENEMLEQFPQKYHLQNDCHLTYCSICDSICSTEMNESINKVQNMEEYLMNLLSE